VEALTDRTPAWLALLGLMQKAEPYEYLLLEGRPIDAVSLALIVGVCPSEVEAAIRGLGDRGVFTGQGQLPPGSTKLLIRFNQ
jgi:hypothetical protein